MSEELVKDVGKAVLRKSLSQAVRHTVNVATGVPGLGDVLGEATNAAYESIPGEIKLGAGAGGFLAVHMGTHIMSVGTLGSIAYGSAVLGAFLPFVAAGAAIGGAVWVAKKVADEL